MEYRVTGCRDCVFCYLTNEIENEFICLHPNNEEFKNKINVMYPHRREGYDLEPTNCPLKKEPIKIILEEQETKDYYETLMRIG